MELRGVSEFEGHCPFCGVLTKHHELELMTDRAFRGESVGHEHQALVYQCLECKLIYQEG